MLLFMRPGGAAHLLLSLRTIPVLFKRPRKGTSGSRRFAEMSSLHRGTSLISLLSIYEENTSEQYEDTETISTYFTTYIDIYCVPEMESRCWMMSWSTVGSWEFSFLLNWCDIGPGSSVTWPPSPARLTSVNTSVTYPGTVGSEKVVSSTVCIRC